MRHRMLCIAERADLPPGYEGNRFVAGYYVHATYINEATGEIRETNRIYTGHAANIENNQVNNLEWFEVLPSTVVRLVEERNKNYDEED